MTAKPGHNSGFAAPQLLAFVERIERTEEEQKALAEDKREIYSEAKSQGFDTKIIRKVIALRKMDPSDRAELQALVDTYMDALRESERAETQQSQEEGE